MSVRLQIINNALIATGNSALNVEYDGSPEWQVADVAYRRAVDFTLSRHNWGFAKDSETINAVTPVPTPRYTHAYAVPTESLHVVGLYVGTMPVGQYEVVGNRICCNLDAAILASDVALSCLYVRSPPEAAYPIGFSEVVALMTESLIYAGLNEDPDEARRKRSDAESYLEIVRSRSDQESGRRAVFRSRTAQRRLHGGRVYRGFP